MPRLTNDEKETLISFDETPNDALIFTYSPKWQKHLETRLGLKPVMDNGFGGKEYHLPKSRVRLPQAHRTLSAEQRQKLGERLARARQRKSPSVL
jgi:hypothetical protein